MPPIKLLEESIAQQIAAGEVVERPSSVIKELVENSIDAGSSFITVEIDEGGIERIRVTDNGCGIPAQEIELAFERHATSKLQTLQDLYRIAQMGFRGEALYSIAAVSRLELTTKPAAQLSGVRFLIHGGKAVSLSEYGCPDGTTIVASDLFYNTPARLKFLAKPSVEAGYVGTVMTRLILSKPAVSMKFVSNGKIIYHSIGDGSLKNAIYTVHGKDVANGLIPVKQYIGNANVEGCLFPPAAARGNRGAQLLVVNGRVVTHAGISGIVERMYGGLTDSRRFPGYVLNLSLPYADVDVNVHPNKLQVRFSNESQVRQLIETAVSKALEAHTHQPAVWAFQPQANVAEDSDPSDLQPQPNDSQSQQSEKIQTPEKPPVPFIPAIKETMSETVSRFTQQVSLITGRSAPVSASISLQQKPSIPNVAPEKPVEQIAFPSAQHIRLIGQLFDTYVLAEYDDKLLILDQHAAHERLWYEKYHAALVQSQPCSQKLLIPQVVTVSYEVKTVLEENLTLLQRLGFELEEYGRLTYQIRAVPFVLGQPQVQDFLLQMLDMLSDERSVRTEELKQEKIMSMACKRAVKAGDRLSQNELAALTEILSLEAIPLTCPHGRPLVIIMDKHSLERQFRRVKG